MVEVRQRYVRFSPPAGATHLIGDFTDWDKRPIDISQPLVLEFPAGAYLEYAFLDAKGQPFADPDNPHKAQNPWWSYPRAIELPGFAPDFMPEPSRSPEVHRHRLESKLLGSSRRYYVYQPPQPAQSTLYVQDGVAYYRTGKMHEVAQTLIERGEINPIRIVFVEPDDRRQEYWFNPTYEAFLLQELMPEVEHHYGSTPTRGLWGASLGGVVSAWLAWRNPQIFGLVGTQSACLTLEPGGDDSYTAPEWLTQQYAHSPKLPLRFYCETGQIEWLLAANRRFAAMLQDLGYPHAYQERASGHNWMTWRQGLLPGLKYLYASL